MKDSLKFGLSHFIIATSGAILFAIGGSFARWHPFKFFTGRQLQPEVSTTFKQLVEGINIHLEHYTNEHAYLLSLAGIALVFTGVALMLLFQRIKRVETELHDLKLKTTRE